MTRTHQLTFSVDEAGIFIHFIARDGSETHIDALSVLEGSSAMTNEPLRRWCCERLEEATPAEISDENRRKLLADIEDISADKEAELEQAEAAGAKFMIENGDLIFNAPEWRHREEQAAEDTCVLITNEAFRVLVALAKKGAA